MITIICSISVETINIKEILISFYNSVMSNIQAQCQHNVNDLLSFIQNMLLGCVVTRLYLIYEEWSRQIWLAKWSPPGLLCVVLMRAELFAVPLGVRMRGSSLEFLPDSGGGWTGLDGWQLGHISGGVGRRGPLSACLCTKCQFEHEGRMEWAKE